MKQLKRLLAVVGVGMVSIASVAAIATPAGADTVGDEQAFIAKLNGLRASQGLPALQVNGQLTDIARGWSAQMAAAGSISHNPALASQAPSNWTRLGENVGVGPDVDGLHNAFVNSPAHYHNMVDGQFNQVGVGVVRSADGTIYVTVDFMTAAGAPVAAAAPAPAPAAARRCTRSRRGKVTCRTVRARRVVRHRRR